MATTARSYYLADLSRDARIYLVRHGRSTPVPPPTSITFYPKRSKKKGF